MKFVARSVRGACLTSASVIMLNACGGTFGPTQPIPSPTPRPPVDSDGPGSASSSGGWSPGGGWRVRRNLLDNGSAEAGVEPWIGQGINPELSQSVARSGLYSILAVNRTARWQGLIMPLEALTEGGMYTLSVWVKLAEDEFETIAALKIRLTDANDSYYLLLDESPLRSDRWIMLKGSFPYEDPSEDFKVDAVITADSQMASFYVDDMVLTRQYADFDQSGHVN